MAVDTVDFGHHKRENQYVTNDGRDIRGLRNPHHQGLDPGEGFVVDENGMSRFEAYSSIVVHVDRDPWNGQILLRGKQRIDLNIARRGGVQPVDEEFQISTFEAVGDDGHLRVHRLPLRHFEVDFVRWNPTEHSEIVHQFDGAGRQRRKPSAKMPRSCVVKGQALLRELSHVHINHLCVRHPSIFEGVHQGFGCRDVDRFEDGECLNTLGFIDASVSKDVFHRTAGGGGEGRHPREIGFETGLLKRLHAQTVHPSRLSLKV